MIAEYRLAFLDEGFRGLLVIGGLPGARMMNPSWAAAVKDDCERTGTHFFMKQMTGKKPIPEFLMRREFPTFAIPSKKL